MARRPDGSLPRELDTHGTTRPPPAAPFQAPHVTLHASGLSIGGDAAARQAPAVQEGAKKRRIRQPASCVSCRKKKLRCNRGDPCSSCTERGIACDWDDAIPLFDGRAEANAVELREQVSRLEELVRVLTAQPGARGAAAPNLLGLVTTERQISDPASSRNASPPSTRFQSFPSRAPQHRPPQKMEPEDTIDLRANDLCEGLAQLTICEFVVLECSGSTSRSPCGPGERGTVLVQEAREHLETMPWPCGMREASKFGGSTGTSTLRIPDKRVKDTGGPAPLGASVFHTSPPPLSDALQYLPTEAEAHSAFTYFVAYVDWYSHPVHISTFEAQWDQLKLSLLIEDTVERDKLIDPFFVATFLGVLAMGLSMMPVKRAMRDGFTGDKDKKVDHWLEGAMTALTCGRFLDNPSVESVRAVVVISTFFVFMAPGESSGAGMGLLSLAIQVAMSLSLHRDPDRTPGKFTFFEAEQRRRLFWSLFMLCILSSASLGRTWAVFDLNNVDCKLPLDCHDHEIVNEAAAKAGTEARRRLREETTMTSMICKMKLAVMAKKINDRAFGVRPVSYSAVLELDRELIEFEESIPSRYRLWLDSMGSIVRPTVHITVTEMRACIVQISLASEFIRIHRPWILLAETDDRYLHSYTQAVKYSKLLLAIYRTPSCNQRWGGLTYKVTSAATLLAIGIIVFPDDSDVDALRACVRSAASQMEAFAAESSLCRKGSRLLQFLLDKEAELRSERQRESRRSSQAWVDNSLPNLQHHTPVGPYSLELTFDKTAGSIPRSTYDLISPSHSSSSAGSSAPQNEWPFGYPPPAAAPLLYHPNPYAPQSYSPQFIPAPVYYSTLPHPHPLYYSTGQIDTPYDSRRSLPPSSSPIGSDPRLDTAQDRQYLPYPY